MKHKKLTEEEAIKLAEDIGDLSYDSLAVFLDKLSKKLIKDSEKDYSNGRIKLSTQLYYAANNINNAKEGIVVAWTISAPYMK